MSDRPVESAAGSVLTRSGVAALSDLQSPEWKQLYTLLEAEQAAFLSKEAEFRSPDYKWPRDALHWWSRVWEYPYAYRHIQAWLAGRDPDPDGLDLLVDLGSGVTFFPFTLANRLGAHVVCVDTDPVCERDLTRAINVVQPASGSVSYRHYADPTGPLPFDDGGVGGIYCVSVLEHIDNLEHAVKEIARVLRDGGLLLLTIDLDLRGDTEIGPIRHQELCAYLSEQFEFRFPDSTTHPANVMTSLNGLFPHQPRKRRSSLWNRVLRRSAERPPGFVLAVQGLVLQRRPR